MSVNAATASPEIPSTGDLLNSVKEGGQSALNEAGKAVKEVQATAKSLRERFKSLLGFDYFDGGDRKWYKDLWHGTVTNLGRRSSEATDATLSALDAGLYSIWRPISHPLQTLFRFDKYMAGGMGRLTVGSLSIMNNYLVRPLTKGLHELYQGTLQKPLGAINEQVAKVPVVGEFVAKTASIISDVMHWPVAGTDILKEKLDKADAALKDYGKFS